MKAVCLHTTSRRRATAAVRQGGYMGRPPAGVTAWRLSRNRMSAPQDCPIRTILLMTTFQGHVALHRRNVNKRREGHSMATWTQFCPFLPPTYLYVDTFNSEHGQKWTFCTTFKSTQLILFT